MRKEIGSVCKGICGLGIVVVAVMVVTDIGVERQERMECLEWQQQAQQYPDYYLLWWQQAQCDAKGIIINAKVQD